MCRDIWLYCSLGELTLDKPKENVGASIMPHKVNPIDFENGEGNLIMANKIFQFLSEKLPISRLQRDLTDSTVSRNIGIPISHTKIALNSLLKGLEKIDVNKKEIESDLENNWSIISEAIQTILRREKVPKVLFSIYLSGVLMLSGTTISAAKCTTVSKLYLFKISSTLISSLTSTS